MRSGFECVCTVARFIVQATSVNLTVEPIRWTFDISGKLNLILPLDEGKNISTSRDRSRREEAAESHGINRIDTPSFSVSIIERGLDGSVSTLIKPDFMADRSDWRLELYPPGQPDMAIREFCIRSRRKPAARWPWPWSPALWTWFRADNRRKGQARVTVYISIDVIVNPTTGEERTVRHIWGNFEVDAEGHLKES